jgi:hypothetical protein
VTTASKTARRGRAKAQHSSANDDWGTGRSVIDIARAVLRYISVDPFSSAKWNAVIGAERIITENQDGFATPWVDHPECPAPGQALWSPGEREARKLEVDRWSMLPLQAPRDLAPQTAHVNPPGERTGRNVKAAWYALDQYHRMGWFAGGAMYVGFTMNQLQMLQNAANGMPDEDEARTPLSKKFLRCVPDSRIAYQIAPGVDAKDPTHPSWFLLMPAIEPALAQHQLALFAMLCRPLGDVF